MVVPFAAKWKKSVVLHAISMSVIQKVVMFEQVVVCVKQSERRGTS